MTHPELIRLEDLVNRLLEGMEASAGESDVDLVNAAREYAEACERANDRLQTCLDILGKGREQEHQALMSATRAPDLLDTCAVLSELQTDEYARFCRENHLPKAPALNERAKQAIDPLYERAGSFQKKLRMEFSAANSRRDFRAALDIARQLARVDPSDAAMAKQASALEDRLVRDVIQKEIAPALEKGDEETAAAALDRIEEIAPERTPQSGERFAAEWSEAIEVRRRLRKEEALRESANYLLQAEAARDADNLEFVLELLARIDAARTEHEFELPPEKEELRRDLEAWKEKALRKAREESNFQAATEELRRKLKQIGDKDFQNTPPGFEENREDALELQRLWKEIAEYRKPVDDELQERARKILGELNEKVDRHKRAKRRNLIAAVSAAAVVILIASIGTILYLRAGRMAERIRETRMDGRAEDLSSHLARLAKESPPWLGLGSLPRERENAEAWLNEQEALSDRMSGRLEEVRNDLESRSDWTAVSLEAMRSRIDEAEKGMENVNRDDRIPLEDEITALRLAWDKRLESKRNEVVEQFESRVKKLETDIREQLRFDRPIASIADSIGEIGRQVSEMQGMASGEMEELRPSAADLARFEVLKERFEEFEDELETVRSIMAKCREAESSSDYSQAIRDLNTTAFLEGEEKVALGDLVVAADSKDRVFQKILMPGQFARWTHLRERAFGSDGHPEDITEDEEYVYLSLRDDDTLAEVYLYDVEQGGKERTIFSRGGTLEQAGKFGDEVYDPAGSSLVNVAFTEREYGDQSAPGGRAIPTNERLSAESRFFQGLEIDGMVDDDFTGFQRAGLGIVDEVLSAPEGVNPVFRAHLFQELGRMMSYRPHKWLLDFSDFEEDLAELREIVGSSLESADWCAPDTREKLGEPLREFFDVRRGKDYLDEARAVYQFYARVFTADLAFAGFVDHRDERVLLSEASAQDLLWGFDENGSAVKAFRKSASGEWEVIHPIAQFSPLFFLRADPAATWREVAEAHFVDPGNEELVARLPARFDFETEKE